MSLAGRRERRSSPSTTCSITCRNAARSPTCSPASARNAPLPRRGFRLAVNAERHLKSAGGDGAAVRATFPKRSRARSQIADACSFSLDELKYEYPDEPVPPGKTPQQHLEDLTLARRQQALSQRLYPEGVPADVSKRLVEELALIAKLDYARYFLTVHDVVAYARSQDILCQGRGSAANSAVCYCLGITEVNPNESKLLFARFISENRNEPPDIDVDFEHERREEVIQYIYQRYGRDRAAICATVIHYRSRRAIREVGKAMGLTPDVTAALAKTVWGITATVCRTTHIRQAGLDPANPTIRQAVGLASELLGFPRHLSQHVGGFVLTRERLDETVPIGNAAMDERTFIEWDKDDIDTLGLMKVDVLALGMLSCLRRGLDLLKTPLRQGLCARDPADRRTRQVYDMLCARRFRRRVPGREPRADVDAAAPEAAKILRSRHRGGDRAARADPGRHGASLSAPARRHRPRALSLARSRARPQGRAQECPETDAGRAAVPGAGDADRHRRRQVHARRGGRPAARHGDVPPQRHRSSVRGKIHHRHDAAAAMRAISPSAASSQIEGFGEYGFPESHAASFALLVYASSWIKCHYPDVFCAAILNSQPMGFYQPAQLVRDARQHGVEVREADVNFSALGLHAGAGDRRASAPLRCASRLPAGPGTERGRAEDAHRGARQRLCQHRTAGRASPEFRASRSSASPRLMPSARSGSTAAPRCGPRGGSTRSACEGHKAEKRHRRAARFRSSHRI